MCVGGGGGDKGGVLYSVLMGSSKGPRSRAKCDKGCSHQSEIFIEKGPHQSEIFIEKDPRIRVKY